MNPHRTLWRHHSIFFIILRRMRAPLIVLITIMAISVLGLHLAPGIDADGNPHHLSFFHAFYFISYTATTIGFGEILYDFSEQQRLWVTACIYMSVVGWGYTVGSLFSLLADRNLQQAIATQGFMRSVRRLQEPFYLVCGYGETGSLILSALDRLGLRAVVIETDENRVGEVDLHGYEADVPALAGDARNPELLRLSGLTHPSCAGVMAITNDDEANLAIAICSRLLAPRLPALCRTESREIAANMASFGTRHIINPFEKFGEYLVLALHAPSAWHLLSWLTGLPGSEIERHRDPPRGHWILCGHGRFGRVLVEAMDREAVPLTIIDREPVPDLDHAWIQGDGTGAIALEAAGIRQAAGILAVTSSDVNNLSIAVTARELNRDIFVVVRQNQSVNQSLFNAFDADITMVPSEIIAHECLAVLTTPLLAPFLQEMRQQPPEWCEYLLIRLNARLGKEVPTVWSVRLNLTGTPALYRRLVKGDDIEIEQLLQSHHNRNRPLTCEVLYLKRDNSDNLLVPKTNTRLGPGDELLLAGSRDAKNELEFALSNPHALTYVLSGEDSPEGWVWDQYHQWRQRRQDRETPTSH